MNYKLAIFDMDGTILYTLEDLADSLNYALSQRQLPVRTLQEVRSFVGNGILKLVERAVPKETSVEEIQQVYHILMKYYQVHCADKTRPYDGICELLSSLRANGCKTAVVSNKADQAVKTLCDSYFPGLFDYAVGEREGIEKKPSPDSVNETLRALQMKREDAVYIGDSEVDLQTACNAGMDSFIVSWGFREKEFLQEQGAKIIVSQPQEIYDLIAGTKQL